MFGIGLSKTGTTSLASALRILGYTTLHYPPLDRLASLIAEVDAATDTSVACSFKELDALFPGSRFVLTVRDERSWLRSAERHFTRNPVQADWMLDVRRRIYRSESWDRAAFQRALIDHHRNVMVHFRGRSHQLLVMNLFLGDGWPSLCQFLSEAVPDVPFPHENVTEYES